MKMKCEWNVVNENVQKVGMLNKCESFVIEFVYIYLHKLGNWEIGYILLLNK